MTLENFSSFIVALVSFSAAITILSLAQKFANAYRKTLTELELKKVVRGLVYLSGSLFIWTTSSISMFLLEESLIKENLKQVFSTINSLSLILGASYIEFSPNWLKTKLALKQKMTFYICILIVLVTVIANFISSNQLVFKMPDFLLSLFTVILLMYSFGKTFYKRGFRLISAYSILSLFLLLIAQSPIDVFSTELFNNFITHDIATSIGLYSRLSFVIIILLLAITWSNSQFQLAKLTIKELKEQVKEERETKTSIEREISWQNIGIIAHQLFNPVISIESKIINMERKLNGKDYKSVRNILDQMKNPLDEAKSLIEQYKKFEDLENLNLTLINIKKLLEACASSIDEEEAFVKIESTIRQPIIKIDKMKITSCFRELFSNALRWLDKDFKTIMIYIDELDGEFGPSTLKKDLKYIRISFEDNGTGVEDRYKKDIFIPSITTHKHGLGLGLAIINKIVKQHNGYIEETGKFTEGAKFDIYLPFIN